LNRHISFCLLILSSALFTSSSIGRKPDRFIENEVRGPRDLTLAFRSEISGQDQAYRLYLPSAYDGTRNE